MEGQENLSRSIRYTANVPAELADLIPGFLNNRKEDIEKLRKELVAENFVEITRIGHTLKGACGGYGFDDLGELGKRIEVAGKDRNVDQVARLIDDMEYYLGHVNISYIESEGDF